MSYGEYPPPPSGPAAGAQDAGAGPSFTLSSWQRRALATLIDTVPVVLAAYFILPLLIAALNNVSHTLAGVAAGIAYVAVTAFTIWQLVRQGQTGQTIGKKQIGISVVRESDARVTGWPMAIVRSIVHIVDILICWIGFLFPLWDAKRQTLADKIVGTVVVDTPKQ